MASSRFSARASWGIADQALSSLTNFAGGFVAARFLDPSGFGAFSLAFAWYSIVVNVSRAANSEPFLLRFGPAAEKNPDQAIASSTGAAVTIGGALGLGSAVAGLLIGDLTGQALIMISLTLPISVLQDAWRFVFAGRLRPEKAFLNDLVWALLLVPLLLSVANVGGRSPATFVFAWSLGAGVAGLVGIFQSRIVPAPSNAVSWLREQSDLASRFIPETLLMSLTGQLIFFILGATQGLTAVGALRGAQLLLGIPTILILGARIAVGPDAVRIAKDSGPQLTRLVLLTSVALTIPTIAITVALVNLSDSLGQSLLGAVWHPALSLLLPVAGATVGQAWQAGAIVGLRALGDARRSLRARTVSGPLMLASSAAAAFWGDPFDVAVAYAASTLLGSLYWIRQYALSSKTEVPGSSDAQVPAIESASDR